MRKVKSFQIRLERERLWFRNEFRLLGTNRVRDFVVQLEILEGQKHFTPVRYDIKHGYFHRDIINRQGKHVNKKKIIVSNLEEAVKTAIDDLVNNWQSLLQIGGYTNILSTLKSIPEESMRKAKGYLIDLVQHPDKIDSVGNVVDLTLTETLSMSDSVTAKLIKGKPDNGS